MLQTTIVSDPGTMYGINEGQKQKSEPMCKCCDDKQYQVRNDGIKIPCPGCKAFFWQFPPFPPQDWYSNPARVIC